MADRLNQKIIKHGNRLTTGFIGCPLLLPVLCRFGHTDTALTLLQQEEYPSWKYPILQGATTRWERWNSYTLSNGFGDAGMNSFNHYSYGSVTEWLYGSLLGITADPDNPGFTHFYLKPTAGGGITFAEGGYRSISGEIRSAWKADENGRITEYSCTVPGNTAATLILEGGSPEDIISVDGISAEELASLVTFGGDGKTLTIELTSGEYHFGIVYK